MPYASSSDVAFYTHSILAGASNFSASTAPTACAVNLWLSSGCAAIEARLASLGYEIPITPAAGAYAWLVELNALYAAAQAEKSRTLGTVEPGQRTRGQVYEKEFWDKLNQLGAMDLTYLGVSKGQAGRLYVGGMLQADKDAYREDSSYVQPRVRRGMWKFPGTLDTSNLSGSGTTR